MKKQIIFISAILTLNIFLIFFPISVKAAPELCWERIREDIVDRASSIAIDSSNNIFLVGNYLVKYNHEGIEQWSFKIEGLGTFESFDPTIEDIAIDSEDNIYVTGSHNSNMTLIKYNNQGTQSWNRSWGGSDRDKGHSVAVDKNTNNIYVTGETQSFAQGGARDIFMAKYDKTGLLIRNITWDGYGDLDRGFGIAIDQSTTDIYITGYTNTGTNDDIVLLKIDATDDLKWNITWDAGYDDCGLSVAIDHSGKIIIAGYRDCKHL